MAPSHRRLQQYALIISVISIVYNGGEGAVSIALGAESSSRSLVFFGIQSGIEVASAAMVVWRFIKIAKPGEEKSATLSARDLRFVTVLLLSSTRSISKADRTPFILKDREDRIDYHCMSSCSSFCLN